MGKEGRTIARFSGQSGFTMLEFIVSLILVGIIGSLVAVGATAWVNGFIFSKKNMTVSQKGQHVFTRLVKELTFADSISNGTATTLNYSTIINGTPQNRLLQFSSGTLNLGFNSNNINVLLDGLDATDGFSLAYYDTFDGTASSTWSSSRKLIRINLMMPGADNTNVIFTTRVDPLNLP